MQIEADQRVCPACGAEGLEMFPVLHHMICAYVGPQYDFAAALDGYTCPKCRRDIVSGDLTGWWLYVVGPLAGAILAVLLIRVVRGRPGRQEFEAAEGGALPTSTSTDAVADQMTPP